MNKINIANIPEQGDKSPKGKFRSFFKGISEALGREPKSRDLDKRHPFDLEWNRLPAGALHCPFHFHSSQWELYVVIAGRGMMRDDHGTQEVGPGDAILFKPGEAHQVSNPFTEDFLYYVIADNPIGESCYYPDSKKWLVAAGTPMRRLVPDAAVDYYAGEE